MSESYEFPQEPADPWGYAVPPMPPAPPRRRHGHMVGLAVTAAAALAVGGVVGAMATGHSGAGNNATAASATVLTTQQIAERVSPALVDVTSTLGYQNATAKGTGVVLTSNGEVLTNNHVVEGSTSVSVRDVGNGKTYKATVVGYNASADVAVLQLQGASGLTSASTGDSSALGVANTVVALGNAGGTDGTPSVAAGTVTALNQSITASDEASGTSEQLSGLIQTDADIQSGDSGGALVNSHAQVIGMNTAASSGYSFSGGNGQSSQQQVQGYAIPINTALSIARQIESGQGSSTVHIGATAFLGVAVAGSNSNYGYGQQVSGVTIQGAESGTPAAQAGLSAGDVITSVAGQSVDSQTSISSVLVGHHPGDKISIAWTDTSGQSHTATVTLATGPAA
jgi:S1-C subfamily serine protease